MKIDWKKQYNIDAQLLFVGLVILLLTGSYLLARHNGSEGAPPLDILAIKTIINFVAAFAVVIAFVTFATDYIPAVRVTGARINPSKNLITYKIENYSKTLIKNTILHHVLFDIPIKDGSPATEKQIHLFLFNLSQEKSFVAPTSSQEFVLNLNRVKVNSPVDKRVTLDLFSHHTFLIVSVKFRFWFLPFKDFRIRGVLYYDRENDEWFGGSEEHPELRDLFKRLFRYLEQDNELELRNILDRSIDRAKKSWGVLFEDQAQESSR